MKTLYIALLLIVSAAPAFAQTAPTCLGALPGTVSGPTAAVFTGSPDHATATGYRIGVFAVGVVPSASTNPLTFIDVPVSALTVVAGEPTCYVARPNMGVLLATPIAALTPYVASLKTLRATDGTESIWSVVSNPFLKPGLPPGAPTNVRMTR